MHKILVEIKELITERSITKTRVFKNTAWLFTAEIGSRAARGVLAIVSARILGTAGLGAFSYVIALGGFLTFFEEAGVALFVTREFSKDSENARAVFGTAIILKLLLLVSAISLFLVVGPIMNSIPDSGPLFPIIALLLVCDSMREFFFSITRAQQNMRIESKIKIITNILIFILGICFISMWATPLSLALAYTIGSAIGCIIIFLYVGEYIPNLLRSFSKDIFKKIFNAAWPFTILAVSNIVIFSSDTLFLGHYSSVSEVGLYSAASRLIQMFYIIPSLFAAVTFPIFVQKIQEVNGLRSALRKSFLSMIIALIPLVCIFTIGSSFIMRILFGVEYLPGAKILTVLAFSYIPIFIGSVLNNAIFAQNIQKKFVLANIIGIILNLALNSILVPRFAGTGAAISTIISLCSITAFTALKIYKSRNTSYETIL
jgi:PST family polysaccharide transporter